jgi:hypothetical protein
MITAMIDQRRPLRVSMVLARAEPEMVEGRARWAGPGSIAARGSVRRTHLVRSTEIAAYLSDCAYFDIACASYAASPHDCARKISSQRSARARLGQATAMHPGRVHTPRHLHASRSSIHDHGVDAPMVGPRRVATNVDRWWAADRIIGSASCSSVRGSRSGVVPASRALGARPATRCHVLHQRVYPPESLPDKAVSMLDYSPGNHRSSHRHLRGSLAALAGRAALIRSGASARFADEMPPVRPALVA